MALVQFIEYEEASPEVRAVYDDILATRGLERVPNVWKAFACNPALLREVWEGLKETMRPGRMDGLAKELVAIAVSASNGCAYCLNSHVAQARKLGLDDALLGELMAVVGALNRTNALVGALSLVPPLAYEEAPPEVRAVYDDILATRGLERVPAIWRSFACHPPLLREVWEGLKEAMRPGRIDALTKEMIAIAVSATNGCRICLESHVAQARGQGLDDALLGELMAVVGAFNRTNALVEGLQVEVDPAIAAAARGG